MEESAVSGETHSSMGSTLFFSPIEFSDEEGGRRSLRHPDFQQDRDYLLGSTLVG
jgi:hypothetical protein